MVSLDQSIEYTIGMIYIMIKSWISYDFLSSWGMVIDP